MHCSVPLAFVERNRQPAMVGFVRICSWASCVNVSSWSLPFVLGKAASRAESARSRVDDLSLLMSSSREMRVSASTKGLPSSSRTGSSSSVELSFVSSFFFFAARGRP